MRARNSLCNIIGVLALYFVKILLAFVGKTCLIRILGDEYNGINALFSSIISMLSIAELGIGSAIIYNLYKPVKENNISEIKTIMKFYRVCYALIAGIVAILGIAITPVLNSFVGEVNIPDNIYLLFYLFLLDAVSSYLLTYKRSILYADQKNYIISVCDIVYTVVLHVSQIAVLLITHNFVFYLTVGITCRILENMVIQGIANWRYPYLRDKNVESLSPEIRRDIVKKVKGLLFHKIGSYIVYGTDNLIISKMVSIVAEGLYSNYLTIITPLTNIISQMIIALQASVGNLLVDNNKKKNYEIYRKIALLNFWLYTVSSVCLFFLVQDFITIWLGKKYLFDTFTVCILSVNFWQTGMRGALGVFKNAAGIYYEDKYIPLLESLINLVSSIVLVHYFGIVGVFLGTFISSLVIFLYSFPVLVYKPLFSKGYSVYVKEMSGYIIQYVGCNVMGFFVSRGIKIDAGSPYIMFIIKALFVLGISNLLLYVVNHRTEEFRYYKNFFVKKFLFCRNKK